MKRTSYANLARLWTAVEGRAEEREPEWTARIRRSAEAQGIPQPPAAQGELLELLVRLLGARSVIAVVTGDVIDVLRLVDGLDGRGQVTAVDSSPEGIGLLRSLSGGLSGRTGTGLRAAKAAPDVFLPRLNAGDYDLIVVGGAASNYAPALAEAPRLLRAGGVIVFTDVMALAHAEEDGGGVPDPVDRSADTVAMRQLIDDITQDERFDTALTPSGTGTLIARLRG
ncbi:methyltransferase [uncultured Bifidobacterium sp.]|uniref:O-methyltransferase n=1 Tax=uncultured Bifidobacterium sp. TaxID=165187 RepID=UPI0028DC2B75|nr:methyltransferase [uncultured Bifidobacterium sp.]